MDKRNFDDDFDLDAYLQDLLGEEYEQKIEEAELDTTWEEDRLLEEPPAPAPQPKVATGPAPKVSAARSGIYDWVQCIVVALLLSVFLFVFVGRVIGVVGDSMNNTLFSGDKVIVSNLFYTPEYGDIVILTSPTFGNGNEPIVKRIIATEGQTIDIDFETGTVTVDGQVLQESYIAEPTYTYEGVDFPVTVPEGCVFVMGDNRNASTDSRNPSIGMVDTRCILGKVYLRILPIERFGTVG